MFLFQYPYLEAVVSLHLLNMKHFLMLGSKFCCFISLVTLLTIKKRYRISATCSAHLQSWISYSQTGFIISLLYINHLYTGNWELLPSQHYGFFILNIVLLKRSFRRIRFVSCYWWVLYSYFVSFINLSMFLSSYLFYVLYLRSFYCNCF